MTSASGSIFLLALFSFLMIIFADLDKDREMFLIKYKNGKQIIPVNVRMDYKNRMEYVLNLSPQSPEKSLTLYDFNKRVIAFKDLRAKHCFVSKMQFETVSSEVDKLKKLQNEIIINLKPVTMYAHKQNLSAKALINLAGSKISRFCHQMKTSLISGVAVRKSRLSRSKREVNYKRSSYGHYGKQSQEYEHHGHETHETGLGQAPSPRTTYRSNSPRSHHSETRYSNSGSSRGNGSPSTVNTSPFGLQAYQSGGYQLNQPLGLNGNGGSFEAGYRASGNLGEGHGYLPAGGLPDGSRPPYFPPIGWPMASETKPQNGALRYPPSSHSSNYDQRSYNTDSQIKDHARYPPTSTVTNPDQVYRFPYKPNGSIARPAFHPDDMERSSFRDTTSLRRHDADSNASPVSSGGKNARLDIRGDNRPGGYPSSGYSNGPSPLRDSRHRGSDTHLPYRDSSVNDNTGSFGDNGITSETKVKTGHHETNAEASSTGAHQGQRSQTQVQGAHAGNGTFSAQAQAGFSSGNTQSQVRGGRDGGSSLSSASVSEIGSAQSQVQVGTPDGTSSGSAQGTFVSGGTQAEAQGYQDGGSAQAQAQSGGLSQSSAQVDSRGEFSSPELFEGEVTAKTSGGFGAGHSLTNLQGSYGTVKKYTANSRGSFDASSIEGSDFRKTPFKPLNRTFPSPSLDAGNSRPPVPGYPPTQYDTRRSAPESDHYGRSGDSRRPDHDRRPSSEKGVPFKSHSTPSYHYRTERPDSYRTTAANDYSRSRGRDQHRPGLGQPETDKRESSSRPETRRPKPGLPDSERAESRLSEPGTTKPSISEPTRHELGTIEPRIPEPNRAEPRRTEARRQEPRIQEPFRPEIDRREPPRRPEVDRREPPRRPNPDRREPPRRPDTPDPRRPDTDTPDPRRPDPATADQRKTQDQFNPRRRPDPRRDDRWPDTRRPETPRYPESGEPGITDNRDKEPGIPDYRDIERIEPVIYKYRPTSPTTTSSPITEQPLVLYNAYGRPIPTPRSLVTPPEHIYSFPSSKGNYDRPNDSTTKTPTPRIKGYDSWGRPFIPEARRDTTFAGYPSESTQTEPPSYYYRTSSTIPPRRTATPDQRNSYPSYGSEPAKPRSPTGYHPHSYFTPEPPHPIETTRSSTPSRSDVPSGYPGTSCCPMPSSCCSSRFIPRSHSCCPEASTIPLPSFESNKGDCENVEITCYTVYKTIGRARICQPSC